MQLNALIIVMACAIGACDVQYTLPVVIKTFLSLGLVFGEPRSNTKGTIKISVHLPLDNIEIHLF